MRAVATLVIRDANLTIDSAEVDHRVEQFVDDAYYQESHLAKVMLLFCCCKSRLSL